MPGVDRQQKCCDYRKIQKTLRESGIQIVQKDHPALREIASQVPIHDIASARTKSIIKIMKEALESEKDGVAIAAPQIAEPIRIFVMSKRVFEIKEKKQTNKKITAQKKEQCRDIAFINPKIIKISKETNMVEEGCLSVRYYYGKVKRAKKAMIEAYDENGKKFKMGGSGLIAQIFQHEIEHLNGILFIDKAIDLENIPPERHDENNI